jgi:hypothetical protein
MKPKFVAPHFSSFQLYYIAIHFLYLPDKRCSHCFRIMQDEFSFAVLDTANEECDTMEEEDAMEDCVMEEYTTKEEDNEEEEVNEREKSSNEEAGDGCDGVESECDIVGSEEDPTKVEVTDPCVFCGQVPCDWDTFGDEISEEYEELQEQKLLPNQICFHGYKLYRDPRIV